LEKAYAEVTQVLKKRPDDGYAHFSLSYVLRYAGLFKEAQHECDAALALDPGDYRFRSCAAAFFLDGDYPRGMEYLALDEGSQWSKVSEVTSLLRQGRNGEALDKARTIADDATMRLAEACLQKRPSSEIEELSTRAHGFPLSDPELRFLTAEIEAFCGRNQVALELLRQAVHDRFCSYPALDSDPLFSPLRQTNEFQEIRSAAIDCQNKFVAYRSEHR